MSGAQAVTVPRSVEKPSSYAWVILAVLYIATVASAFNQFKAPPVLPVLISAFNLTLSDAGLLMSVFSVTGFILALPAGFILHRLGLKATGVIAMGAVVAGSTLGLLCKTTYPLLVSRFIEGAGIGLITIVAPAAIAAWFPAEKRGTPIGLWATCMPVGNIITFNVAPWLAELAGWQLVWKTGAVFGLIAFLLFLGLFRMPRTEEAPREADPHEEDGETPGFLQALANPGIWLVALQFLCFNVICLALGTYYPTFLSSVRNYSLSTASFVTSLSTIAAVFSQPVGGYLSDRLGMRRHLIIVSTIIVGFVCLFPFSATGWAIPAVILGFGIVSGAIVPATFAAVPELMGSRRLTGLGMAVLAMGQNLGMLIGPLMFGHLVESVGWTGAGYALIPVCAVSVVAVYKAKFR